MDIKEVKRLHFLRRMAISHLIYSQLKEKTRTFTPTEQVPDIQTECAETEKLIIEIDEQLNTTEQCTISM